MSKDEIYKDYLNRYNVLYNEMNDYNRRKSKYIFIFCGLLLMIFTALLFVESIFIDTLALKLNIAILIILFTINLLSLFLSEKSLEEAIENENLIYETKCALSNLEMSATQEKEIRDMKFYAPILRKLNICLLGLIIIITILTILVFF